ncbi:SsrA-binding protein SmpB [Olegusella massiliensis]|uniref:SsrA-binding protein SmpB n=1 Tax=Olegusella massiliensis TaxID=1776381 RepID=UPI0026095E2B|nr:SsrA-binding protein SmpB [Olegusella massiliensis]
MAQKTNKRNIKLISRNRSARHEYEIEETWEAGIELTGTEVRSLRERACQISDSYCIVRNGQLWLVGVHIHPFSHGTVWNVDPDRRRRLLMHKRQINYLDEKLRIRGMAIVPLQLYFDEHNRVKLQIGLARGKKLYDKRHDLAQRQSEREMQRALKERSRY